jgi:hypothetical protein
MWSLREALPDHLVYAQVCSPGLAILAPLRGANYQPRRRDILRCGDTSSNSIFLQTSPTSALAWFLPGCKWLRTPAAHPLLF